MPLIPVKIDDGGVPKFKASGNAKFDAGNKVYCQCHQSVYDPFLLRMLTFAARPRPE